MEINAKTVQELFDYDPEAGVLYWRERPLRPECPAIDKAWNTRFVGKVAGRPDKNGHLYANITYKNYAVHRLVWLHVHGRWPDRDIDHANGNPADNRISNLRQCTHAQNMRNSRVRRDNAAGVTGVYWAKNERKWRAYINVNGKMKMLGAFGDKNDAIECRRRAAIAAFGEFAKEHRLSGGTR